MKLHVKGLKTCGLLAPISYKTDPTAKMKTYREAYSLKVDIKNHLVKTGSETFLLYITVFRTGSPEAWLKFQTTLQKIIKGQSINNGPQMHAITKNLLTGESLRVVEHHSKKKQKRDKG